MVLGEATALIALHAGRAHWLTTGLTWVGLVCGVYGVSRPVIAPQMRWHRQQRHLARADGVAIGVVVLLVVHEPSPYSRPDR